MASAAPVLTQMRRVESKTHLLYKKRFSEIPFSTGSRVRMTAKGQAVISRKTTFHNFASTGTVEAVIDRNTLLVLVDNQKFSNRWHVSFWERVN